MGDDETGLYTIGGETHPPDTQPLDNNNDIVTMKPIEVSIGTNDYQIPTYDGTDVIGSKFVNATNLINVNTDEFGNPTDVNGNPIDPATTGSSTPGFFESLFNALGQGVSNVANNAINTAVTSANKQINKTLPPNPPATGVKTTATSNTTTSLLIVGAVVVVLVLLARKKS